MSLNSSPDSGAVTCAEPKHRAAPRRIPGVSDSPKRGYIVTDRQLVGGNVCARDMLGQLRYLLEPGKNGIPRFSKYREDGRYWFAASQQYWMQQLGYSHQEVRTGIKKLVKSGAAVCRESDFGNWGSTFWSLNLDVTGIKLRDDYEQESEQKPDTVASNTPEHSALPPALEDIPQFDSSVASNTTLVASNTTLVASNTPLCCQQQSYVFEVDLEVGEVSGSNGPSGPKFPDSSKVKSKTYPATQGASPGGETMGSAGTNPKDITLLTQGQGFPTGNTPGASSPNGLEEYSAGIDKPVKVVKKESTPSDPKNKGAEELDQKRADALKTLVGAGSLNPTHNDWVFLDQRKELLATIGPDRYLGFVEMCERRANISKGAIVHIPTQRDEVMEKAA